MKIEELVAALGNNRSLFHFTDGRNLPSVSKHGLLSLRELRRRGIKIEAPGGNDWSQDSATRRGLDQYVNLSLRDRHPMEYVATKEGRVKDAKYLQVKLEVLMSPAIRFTADVSNKAGVPLLTWEEAQNAFDWEILYTHTDWKDPAIQTRLRQASKYEVLVPDNVPIHLLKNI